MNFIETSRFKRAYKSFPTFQIVRDYFILRNVGHHDPTLKNP